MGRREVGIQKCPSDQSQASELSCSNHLENNPSTNPNWIKKWVSKDNFNPQVSQLSCSGVDQLTQREIDLLRHLHSKEAYDYAKGFYFNEFFDSIKVMRQCE